MQSINGIKRRVQSLENKTMDKTPRYIVIVDAPGFEEQNAKQLRENPDANIIQWVTVSPGDVKGRETDGLETQN